MGVSQKSQDRVNKSKVKRKLVQKLTNWTGAYEANTNFITHQNAGRKILSTPVNLSQHCQQSIFDSD